MNKIKISVDSSFSNKYLVLLAAILLGIFTALGVINFLFCIFGIICLIGIYDENKTQKSISFDEVEFIYIENEAKVPVGNILKIENYDEGIWILTYIDEYGQIQNTKFIPVFFTLRKLKKLLLEKNPNAIIDDF